MELEGANGGKDLVSGLDNFRERFREEPIRERAPDSDRQRWFEDVLTTTAEPIQLGLPYSQSPGQVSREFIGFEAPGASDVASREVTGTNEPGFEEPAAAERPTSTAFPAAQDQQSA